MTPGYWQYKTKFGIFRIVPRAGSFNPFFEDEDLGAYHSVEAALDDLIGGHTFFPSNGLDPSTCGLPDEITGWAFVVTA
jgi:hypothetical protein